MALGAMAQDSDEADITQSLQEAVRLRSDYLRGQADHLTLPAVRRLLERDLGLRASQLDVHKALIKRLVDKVLNDGEDEAVATEKPRKRRKNTARVVDDEGEPANDKPVVQSTEKKRKLSEDGSDVQEQTTTNDGEGAKKLDDSQPSKSEGQDGESREKEAKPGVVEEKQNESSLSEVNVDENSIKEALMKRADELKSRAESITVTNVRRLLEEDLGLEPNKLDVHKIFIRNLVYKLLESTNGDAANTTDEKDEVVQEGKAKKVGKGSKKKTPSVESEEHGEKGQGDADSTGSDSEGAKQRKGSKKKTTTGKKKGVEVKKPAESKKPFGANVERLRGIFKTIDLGIPPAAYAKAKQAPEDERDDVLCKELEILLGKVGLSANPSQQEIRKVKAQLRKKKDLDGIDNTNIVSEPRRNRASANSWFTPKPVNRYLQDERKSDKTPEAEESDEEGKPKVTGPMDD